MKLSLSAGVIHLGVCLSLDTPAAACLVFTPPALPHHSSCCIVLACPVLACPVLAYPSILDLTQHIKDWTNTGFRLMLFQNRHGALRMWTLGPVEQNLFTMEVATSQGFGGQSNEIDWWPGGEVWGQLATFRQFFTGKGFIWLSHCYCLNTYWSGWAPHLLGDFIRKWEEGQMMVQCWCLR